MEVCQLPDLQVPERVRKGRMYPVHQGILQHRHIHVLHPVALLTTGEQEQPSQEAAALRGAVLQAADLLTHVQAAPQPITDLRVPVRVVQEAAEAQ